MKDLIGFGVIGNFAGHLEQAGEDKNFCEIDDHHDEPKGIFPFYTPHDSSFLSRYCIDNKKVILPDIANEAQAEPEIALECVVEYDDNHKVTNLIPKYFMAFNDVSIRNDTVATKLSQKKNFSNASKGFGIKIPIDIFDTGGICDRYCLTSFLLLDNVAHQYGEVSRLIDYSFFYTKLVKWMIDKLNTQQDEQSLENLSDILKRAEYPSKMLIAIGATKYTSLGQSRFLKHGDEVCIVAYDGNKLSNDDIKYMLEKGVYAMKDTSIVRQKVYVENQH